jgi:hypothetical protein
MRQFLGDGASERVPKDVDGAVAELIDQGADEVRELKHAQPARPRRGSARPGRVERDQPTPAEQPREWTPHLEVGAEAIDQEQRGPRSFFAHPHSDSADVDESDVPKGIGNFAIWESHSSSLTTK